MKPRVVTLVLEGISKAALFPRLPSEGTSGAPSASSERVKPSFQSPGSNRPAQITAAHTPTDAVQTGAFLALRYSSVCPFYCAITESIKHPFETPWTSADTQTVVKLTFFAVSVITAVKPSEKQHIKTQAPQSQGGKANVELRFCSSYRSPGDHTGPGIPADKTCSKPAKQAMGNAALPKSTRAPPSSSSSISLYCHFPGQRRESPLIQITWPTRGSSDLGMKL